LFEWRQTGLLPFLSCHRPSYEAFHFLPAPFFLQGYLSSCSPLQLFVPHQSGNVCVCFLPPIPIWPCPILRQGVFLCHVKMQPLQTSGSLPPCSFHSLHLRSSFQDRR